MWRIVYVDNPSGSEPLPNGLRNDDGFVCFFVSPVFWLGQEQRYLEECALLRKHAEIMCAALNQEAV